jgi:hypothetical protein
MNTKKLLILFSMIILSTSVLSAQDFKYIGAAKCKMCHNKPDKGEQYKKWAAGPHANAMKSLTGDDATNPKCLKCHSTAASADPALIATLTTTEGVSCESCHGPGSSYKSMTVMKDRAQSIAKGLVIPDEKVCRKCHNEESPEFKGFNFAEYYAKIAHEDPTTP